ncbi:hypothetical protein H4R18_000532 [Coemansia javaensis]|uniref:Elongation factor 1-gamma n=1 Tax=Coemansia javaensis TaxID=2761396 RepID=A0A9W8HHZ4_9FUNG|nr:hypothetical protein H4R18_000532 [Coemansia javaensis]
MAPIGTLYGPTANARNYKVRIVAQLAGVDVASTPDFVFGVDNQKPEYLAKNPSGKVPVFEAADGSKVFDSSAIAFYVASKAANSGKLLGNTDEERAAILQYSFFAEADLMPAAAGTLYPVLGYIPLVKPTQQAAEQQLKRLLGVLNNILLDKTYLVGERITVADIIVACDLVGVFEHYLTADDRKELRNLTRYFKTVTGQAAFKAVAGPAKLCVTRTQPAAPAKEKKEKKEKKPQQPAQPKAEKKAEKKKKDDDDDDEDDVKPEPKPKSKLDTLPPTSMPLDSWKRFYSNNDTKPTAMDWLWQNYDASGYSFWKVEYKYNDELTLLFMTNNLIGGVFNRLEAARKYAFGVLLALGEDRDNMIWGYFIVRGASDELPEEIAGAPDFDSFTWTRVDHTNPATRAEIEDCFAWDGPTLPRKFADGKVFK